MKKSISVILTLALLVFGALSLSVSASEPAPESTIPSGLVVAFDFEGDSDKIQLADKATEGDVKDNLSIAGSVTVSNGVAVVSSSAGSQLKFNGTDDLKDLTGYTVYTKMKATGNYGSNWNNVVNAPGLIKFIITGKSGDNFNIVNRVKQASTTPNPIPESGGLKDGEWLYLAYTASIEDGKLKAATYYSADGETYVSADAEYDVTYTAMSVTNATVIGQKQDGTIEMSFDDLMIFNRALTADEVKTLASVTLPEPEIETEESTPQSAETPSTPAATQTTPKTETPTTTKAPEKTAEPTTTAAPDTTSAESGKAKGCKSALEAEAALILVATLCLAAFAVAGSRRKKEN